MTTEDPYLVEASGGGWLKPDHGKTAEFLKAGLWPKHMAESIAAEKSKRHAVEVHAAWIKWSVHHVPKMISQTMYEWLITDSESE